MANTTKKMQTVSPNASRTNPRTSFTAALFSSSDLQPQQNWYSIFLRRSSKQLSLFSLGLFRFSVIFLAIIYFYFHDHTLSSPSHWFPHQQIGHELSQSLKNDSSVQYHHAIFTLSHSYRIYVNKPIYLYGNIFIESNDSCSTNKASPAVKIVRSFCT